MKEALRKAIFQRLNLDKPILALHEEDGRLILYLLGGEIVQVEPTGGEEKQDMATNAAAHTRPAEPAGRALSDKRPARKT